MIKQMLSLDFPGSEFGFPISKDSNLKVWISHSLFGGGVVV